MQRLIKYGIALIYLFSLLAFAGHGNAANLGAASSDAPLPFANVTGAEPTQTAASQAEMEAGTEAGIRSVSPLRVAQAISALGTSGINDNLLINGDFRVAQRGTTFDSTTTPANSDDTYLLDRWILLSDGNDIADVSQETTTVPTGAYAAIKLDAETANKKFGLVQIIEARDAARIIGGVASLSFKARKGASNATLDSLRAAVVSWSSTADTVTSDLVDGVNWGAEDANPTLAANWTLENTPSNLTLTDTYQTFSIANISIDTASAKNVGVFIWVNNSDATVGDLAYIADVKLEVGASVTSYAPRPIAIELDACQWRYERLGGDDNNQLFISAIASSTTSAFGPLVFKKKARIPNITTTPSNSFTVWQTGGAPVGSAVTFANVSTHSTQLTIDVATGLTSGGAAIIMANNTTCHIYIDAEL